MDPGSQSLYASAEADLVIKNGEGTGALKYQKDCQEADANYQEAGMDSPIGVNAINNWTQPDGESPKEGTPEVGLEKKETPTAMTSSGSGSRKVAGPAPAKPAPKPMQMPPRNLFKKPAEVQPSTKKAVSGPVGASASVAGGKTAVKVGSSATSVSTKASPHTSTFKKPGAIEVKPPVKKTTSGPPGASSNASGSGVKTTPKAESSAVKKPAGGASVPKTNVVHKPATQDQDSNNNKKAKSGHGTTSKSANLVHGIPVQSQSSAEGNPRVLKNNNAMPGPASRPTGGINKPIVRGQGPTATQSAPHPPPARKIVQKPAETAGKK